MNLRLICLASLLMPFHEATAADSIDLVCNYENLLETTAETIKVVPRELTVDLVKQKVAWSSTATSVAASISDRTIEFEYSGYSYTVSRITGAIRFHNPAELERYKIYRREMTQGLMMQGYSADEAKAKIKAGLRNTLGAQEVVGQCDLVEKARF